MKSNSLSLSQLILTLFPKLLSTRDIKIKSPSEQIMFALLTYETKSGRFFFDTAYQYPKEMRRVQEEKGKQDARNHPDLLSGLFSW